MRQLTLRDAIDGKVILTESQINCIIFTFCRRCKNSSKAEAFRRLMHPTTLPGLHIFEQVVLLENGIEFIAAQDYEVDRKHIQRRLTRG